jgi:hypothetical protein
VHMNQELIHSTELQLLVECRDSEKKLQAQVKCLQNQYEADYHDNHRIIARAQNKKLHAEKEELERLLSQARIERDEARALHQQIAQLASRGANPLSSLVRLAEEVITAEGPMVPLSKLAESLYSSSKPAKDQITAAGGMKRWLQKWPEVFELHGSHEPGFEQASLRNARMRAPTEVDLNAAAGAPAASRASNDAPESTSSISNKELKMMMGEASSLRDPVSKPTRQTLGFVVHLLDSDPHRLGHNPYADKELVQIRKVLRAAKQEKMRSRSVPREGRHDRAPGHAVTSYNV